MIKSQLKIDVTLGELGRFKNAGESESLEVSPGPELPQPSGVISKARLGRLGPWLV